MANCTLKREERIKSKKLSEALFAGGATSHSVFPIRVVYKNLNTPTSILVSVSKKRFKHAVDRNRVKRLIREAYRLNKASLLAKLEEKNTSLAIAFIYISTKKFSFEEVQNSMTKILTMISEDLDKKDEHAKDIN